MKNYIRYFLLLPYFQRYYHSSWSLMFNLVQILYLMPFLKQPSLWGLEACMRRVLVYNSLDWGCVCPKVSNWKSFSCKVKVLTTTSWRIIIRNLMLCLKTIKHADCKSKTRGWMMLKSWSLIRTSVVCIYLVCWSDVFLGRCTSRYVEDCDVGLKWGRGYGLRSDAEV